MKNVIYIFKLEDMVYELRGTAFTVREVVDKTMLSMPSIRALLKGDKGNIRGWKLMTEGIAEFIESQTKIKEAYNSYLALKNNGSKAV
jgi:hypothetical protein